MKRKLSLAALLLASAVGAASADTGLAGDISIELTPFMSTQSRDEVRAGVLANRDEIAALHAEDGGSSRLQFTSSRSRAEVTADYIAHRAEVAAMNGEDSGSELLASTTRANVSMRLAKH